MMKKILVLFGLIILFAACDYATDNIALEPDIEVVGINPHGSYTYLGDTTSAAMIDTIKFVAENSVDCYLDKLVWEYYDESGNMFDGPHEIALYFKINGIVDPAAIDTAMLFSVPIPFLPVWNNIDPGSSARVLLHFIAVDEYYGSKYDTCTIWFGIAMWPQ
jgi:hypothetical protein